MALDFFMMEGGEQVGWRRFLTCLHKIKSKQGTREKKEEWRKEASSLYLNLVEKSDEYALFPRKNLIPQGIIGCGGMGIVFAVQHRSLNQPRVVKVPYPCDFYRFDEDEEDWAGKWCRHKERFAREFQLPSQFQKEFGDARIVNIYDADFDDRRPYMVMELVEGPTLRDRLDQSPPLSVVEKISLATQLIEVVGNLHRGGILHRDIKLSNIIITEEKQLKLVDFGLAKGEVDTPLTSTGAVLGTEDYIAPEIKAGGMAAASPASDIFAVGVALTKLFGWKLNPEKIDEPRANCILKAVESSRKKRYQSIDEMLEDWKAPSRPTKTKRVMAVGVLVVLLAAVGVGFSLWALGKKASPTSPTLSLIFQTRSEVEEAWQRADSLEGGGLYRIKIAVHSPEPRYVYGFWGHQNTGKTPPSSLHPIFPQGPSKDSFYRYPPYSLPLTGTSLYLPPPEVPGFRAPVQGWEHFYFVSSPRPLKDPQKTLRDHLQGRELPQGIECVIQKLENQ